MRNCERSYPVNGTSALKPRPCVSQTHARIIDFPTPACERSQLRMAQNPTSLTRRQSAVLLVIGCILSFGALLLPF